VFRRVRADQTFRVAAVLGAMAGHSCASKWKIPVMGSNRVWFASWTISPRSACDPQVAASVAARLSN
jgi:hypothetical protein